MGPKVTATALLLSILIQSGFSIDYPRIQELSREDTLYRQQQEDVRLYHIRATAGLEVPPLVVYIFDAEEHESLLTVAARLNIPYSSIATLNGLTGTDLPVDHRELLIPNIPGMFIPVEPRNSLDRILLDVRSAELPRDGRIQISTVTGNRDFYFLPGEDFGPQERRTFLGAMFIPPVRATRLSSRFGYRRHPITGMVQYHMGVDLAAPYGSNVRASADGVVSAIGTDRLLGTYIAIRHSGGYETRYAHLSKTLVTLNDTVSSGTIIGRVGTTGLTTGPHLHFELREDGRPKDPLLLLPRMDHR